jgi:4-amino-4-deoxy-L-arabinose transferase-like glycosyltransferase
MPAVTRLKAALIVLVLWAAIYLPGLGSTEIKGEEGRRILPAVTMLEGGSWLVPEVGGKPYLRKPPLVNWLIAASFRVTGVRNEWTARMPSALCVLTLALVIVALSSGKGWMNPETGLIAALLAITQFGLLAKARFAGAEIEGIYVPLCGMAITVWMAFWTQRRSPWLTWIVPWVFLGLGCLAKGPSLHLLFFYGVVLSVLCAEREWRKLWHPAHGVGCLVAAGIFLLWAWPFFSSPEAQEAANVWKRQGIDRFTESDFNLRNYLLNIPRALMDLMPWILLAPGGALLFAGSQPSPAPEEAGTRASDLEPFRPGYLRAVAIGCSVLFFCLLLVPGVLPRYVLPLGLPFALLSAFALQSGAVSNRSLRGWFYVNRGLAALLLVLAVGCPVFVCVPTEAHSLEDAVRAIDLPALLRAVLASSLYCAVGAWVIARRFIHLKPIDLLFASSALAGGAALLYATAAIRWINLADDLRPQAAAIHEMVPIGSELVLYDPGYLPATFYLRKPYRYALSPGEIPAEASYLIARPSGVKKINKARPEWTTIHTLSRNGKPELMVLRKSQ